MSQAEPATADTRAAHTPPVDIIGGCRLILYSDWDAQRFRGCDKAGSPRLQTLRLSAVPGGSSPFSSRSSGTAQAVTDTHA